MNTAILLLKMTFRAVRLCSLIKYPTISIVIQTLLHVVVGNVDKKIRILLNTNIPECAN